MWKRVLAVFKWYFNFSQVNAISQAREENRKSLRLMWVMAYLFGWGMTLYLVVGLIQDIMEYKVDTNIRHERMQKMPFPSVTICPNNRIQCQHLYDAIINCENNSECDRNHLYCGLFVNTKCAEVQGLVNIIGEANVTDHTSSICYRINDTQEWQNYLSQAKKKGYKTFYGSLTTEEMKSLAHQPKDLFINCTFGKSEFAWTLCNHLMSEGGTRIFSSSFGVCYAFNARSNFPADLNQMIRDLKNNKEKELSSRIPGSRFGLQLLINIEGEWYQKISSENIFLLK